MLQGNEHFVIVKLVSGEQLMAVLEHETERDFHLVYPMSVRTIPSIIEGAAKEHVTCSPYYQFADDAHISINKQHVIYCKNLHQMLIRHYISLVEENESKVLVSRHADGSVKKAEDLKWEEELEEEAEELTEEEIKKRIEMLESIMEEEGIEDEANTFVTGNKTLH